MANPEHLEILKRGVKAWNEWRLEHQGVHPDLNGADLSDADLRDAKLINADLSYANLSDANLSDANLGDADLSYADLSYANLGDADLSYANLSYANLSDAVLGDADLSYANLSYANLSDAVLGDADLGDANLISANLSNADLFNIVLNHARLSGADFTSAKLDYTTFADNDLSEVKGLEAVIHVAPSSISIDTLYKSAGKIPEAFLRGCGLSDWQIESAKLYQPELSNEEITTILYRVYELRAHQAIQISPLFISYSHADSPFVDKMEAHLNKKGVRFWRDVHHATAGRLEKQIDRAIRLNPTVLLILSSQSVKSDWVEHEVRLARKLEQETGRDVLCPVALDDSWKTCRWPERLREQIMEYNILDFSNWQDAVYMQRMFTRLIEGLGLFYK